MGQRSCPRLQSQEVLKPTPAPNRPPQVPSAVCPAGGFRLGTVLFAKGKKEKIIGVASMGSHGHAHLQGRPTYFLVQPLIARCTLRAAAATVEAEHWVGLYQQGQERPRDLHVVGRAALVWDLSFALSSKTGARAEVVFLFVQPSSYECQAPCRAPSGEQSRCATQISVPRRLCPVLGMGNAPESAC